MPEQFIPVTWIMVNYVCDRCGAGSMQHTGIMKTSNPPWYPHVCTACGHKQDLTKTYPDLRTVEQSTDVPDRRAQDQSGDTLPPGEHLHG